MSEGIGTAGSVIDVEPKTPRRGVWGWMLFDWAAQPFFTVVTTFIFGPYFVSRMAADPAAGQAAWGYGIAAAALSSRCSRPCSVRSPTRPARASRGSASSRR